MRLLIVTEKCGPEEAQRDGGARLVATLRRAFGDSAAIAQFGDRADPSATWRFPYPTAAGDRFAQRLARAPFVAARVGEIAEGFTDVVYVHASMRFAPAEHHARTWLFPMFLTPSYTASGERVPEAYTEAEREALAAAHRVLTPSHLERRQLTEHFGVEDARIRVVPRGVERGLFPARVRTLDGPPTFCSIGSIKRQKNTVALIRLFASLRARYTGARLRVVGPVQDPVYAQEVRADVERFGLGGDVELVGHVAPELLAEAVADAHIHLSAATCETFGRAIFETLANGLPNVARATGNAAAEFLARFPCARFVDSEEGAVEAVAAMLADLPRLSGLAADVGDVYDDAVLANLLAAEVAEAPVLAVADWDGTLFHKGDPACTARSIRAFHGYALRVVCSARELDDLRASLAAHDVLADWIVASSGAVVADARGRVVWRVPVEVEPPCERRCTADGVVVQLAGLLAETPAVRIETYQGVRFGTSWRASKLRAVVWLLREIHWAGRVRAFGDGPHDEEMLAYFDGTLVGRERGPSVVRTALEVADA